ncbi:MAG: hypothetical protein U9N77_08670 [Thermodesulfobacteriota bacterium]|nr:hypothetical protein [Thermodesulfobacteriota bacterium]
MVKDLKKIYIMILGSAGFGFLILGLAKGLKIMEPGAWRLPPFYASLLFILSAITSIAAPVLIRTLFAHNVRSRKSVNHDEFFKFEKNILYMVLLTPWFALAAYLCDFQKFYSAGIVLMAFYALYFYYPSEKRINFDKKIFRVRELE